MKTRKMLASALLLTLLMLSLCVRTAWADDITVTTHLDTLDAAANCAAVTADLLPGPDGVTSLREAMCAANNTVDTADAIDFNIPGAGVQTIDLDSALPQLVDGSTTIDGYTQFGAAPATDTTPATIMIEIDGTGILNNGFNVTSSGNEIRGLAIYGFVGSEIYMVNYLEGVANDNVIAGNYLGTDASGLVCPAAAQRGLNGVYVGNGAQNNTIGGDSPADRNLISCNGWEGVGIHGSGTTGNVVSGNYIGVSPTGTTSRNNALDGVRIYGGAQNNTVGGDTAGERNIISGNERDGVRIAGEGTTGNVVSGNYIGLEPNGASDRGNAFYGVFLGSGAQNNAVGGDRTAGEANLISGNLMGVVISDTTTMSNTVSGNYIGTNFNGTVDAGNSADGVGIIGGAKNNLIGGDTPGERNIISGNDLSGVYITDNDTTGNVVSGNYIGTAVDGLTGLGNGGDGVYIVDGAQNNLIGGTTGLTTDGPCTGACNLISGNDDYGIFVGDSSTTGNIISGNYIGTTVGGTAPLGHFYSGIRISEAQNNTVGPDNIISGNHRHGMDLAGHTMGNVVFGNYIGVDASGANRLSNEGDGIYIIDGSENNTIGPDNVISGNGSNGIDISDDASSNTVSGNYIGVDASGANGLGNDDNGVVFHDDASGNTIGPDNVISGNGDNGVVIQDEFTEDNVVFGNHIGVDASGTHELSNTGCGVSIFLDAQDNIIGGDETNDRNVISGNGACGVYLSGSGTSGNTIAGNYIGVDASGALALHNGDNGGVNIQWGAHDNTIGPGNLIASNHGNGVSVGMAGTVGNVVTQNSIYQNEALGIDLRDGGNNSLAAPTIVSVSGWPVRVTGSACAGCTVEIFANNINDNEGQVYLASGVASGGGVFEIPVSSVPYAYLTATATDDTDGTSEFSLIFATTVVRVVYLPIVLR